MYLPLGEFPEKMKLSRAGARVLFSLVCLAFAGLFLFASLVHAACSNPSPLPSGYAAPCPVFSVSPASVSQTGALALTATPQAGTDYIYTTAYYTKGSTWLPITLIGNNAAPSYSTAQASGSLNASILSSLPLGTNYVVLWDWLWDATAGCYKGPGLNQCNTGTWRVQTFGLAVGGSSCLTSTPAFQGQAIPSQTGFFRITFDATPNGSSIDGDTGLSLNPATVRIDMAAIVEFNTQGAITAINGSTYQAASAISYTAGSVYHFRLDVNIPTHTYSAYVTPAGQTEQTIGLNYASRATQANVTALGYLNVVSDIGTHTMCNVAVSALSTATPTPTPSPTSCSNCNNYYVSASGSDSNNGTSPSAPWKTIAHADASFSLGAGGAVIHVAAGTYPANSDITRGGSSKTVRLILQCDPGVASATAAIAKCMISGSGVGILVESNNVDIIGFDIGNNINMATALDVVTNSGTTGNSVHLIGNYIHDLASNVPPSGTDPGGPGCPETGAILFQGAEIDAQALRNVVARFGSLAARPICNFAQGIYFSGNPGAIAQDNIVIQPVVGGIVLGASCNATITNNTVINTKDAIIFGDHDNFRCPGGVSGNNTVANNYLGNFTNGIFNVSAVPDCTPGALTLISHNITDGLGVVFKPVRSSCDMVINAPTPVQAGSSFFVNYQTNGTGDYHLKAGSAGINAGATTCVSGGTTPCTPSTDFAGNGWNGAIDVGAYGF